MANNNQFESNLIWEMVFEGIIAKRKTAGITYGIRIEIRTKEQGHNTPHCHAVYGAQNISISLTDFSVLAGNIPPSKQSMAMKWVQLNKTMLIQVWNQYHSIEI